MILGFLVICHHNNNLARLVVVLNLESLPRLEMVRNQNPNHQISTISSWVLTPNLDFEFKSLGLMFLPPNA